MKKITILAAVVALLGSCAQNTEDTIKPNTKAEGRTIYAKFDNEEEETKTYVENYKYLRWHAGDEISFFDATTHNSQYAFAGNDGDAEGEFNAVATGEGAAIATTYGVYPYNANTTISTEGVLSVELPATQAYGVNSFGKGANTMVAVGESATDDKLFFKNACGYLVVKLYNESGATVKSLVLKGNNEEKIAGTATITATYSGVPSVTMTDTATTSVTIDCGEGVEIGTTAETATEFWFALPEITFEGGITITATDTKGKEYEKTTTKPVVITRNNVQPMKALSCEFDTPNTWKIYYTATEKVEPYKYAKFGASIVSNEWNGLTDEGVIIFDGEITQIGDYAFRDNAALSNIIIPNSVTKIGMQAFYNCKNLYAVKIPDSVCSLDQATFAHCTLLRSVEIGDGVNNIPSSAFNGCVKLSSVTIGNNVTTIQEFAFKACTSLTSVSIPENVLKIYRQAFVNCDNLKSFQGENASIDGRCIIIDGELQAFAPASITEYTIPTSVKTIGDGFNGCDSIESITFYDNVTSIKWMAFAGCSSLERLYCLSTNPPLCDSAFLNYDELISTIYVPTESVEVYKSAPVWSEYSSIIVGV